MDWIPNIEILDRTLVGHCIHFLGDHFNCCNNALCHLYGHAYKYSKCLFKHRASDDDDDGLCTYESNSSSHSSSEVEEKCAQTSHLCLLI